MDYKSILSKKLFFFLLIRQSKYWISIKTKKKNLLKKAFYRLNKSVNRNKNLIQHNVFINT